MDMIFEYDGNYHFWGEGRWGHSGRVLGSSKSGFYGHSGGRGGKGNPGGSQPRGSVWAPVMSVDEATRWSSGNTIQEILYHGTTPERRGSITTHGFDLSRIGETSGQRGLFGDGVNLARSRGMAQNYSVTDPETGEPTILSIRVNVRNVAGESEFLKVVEDTGYAKNYSIIPQPGEFLRQAMMSAGYDAVDFNGEVTVFDPKNVVVVEGAQLEEPYLALREMGYENSLKYLIENDYHFRTDGKKIAILGSSKSGHYGHKGIPGHRGGSAPRSGVVWTKEETQVLHGYTWLDAETINSRLRSGETLQSGGPFGEKIGDAEKVELLDSAIGKAPPTKDATIMYRAFDLAKMNREGKLKEGEEILDPGYLSVSSNPGGSAPPGTRFIQRAVMELDIPKGTRGVLNLGGISHYPQEKEFLIARGATYKITSVVPPENTYIDPWVIKATLLSPKSLEEGNLAILGGSGSGHHGHAGIPGHRGGSQARQGGFNSSMQLGLERCLAKGAQIQGEYGIILDSSGNTLIEIKGEASHVMNPDVLPDDAYATLHNHPSEGTFSGGDVIFLMNNEQLRTSAVIDPTNTVYKLEKTAETPTAEQLYPDKMSPSLYLHDDIQKVYDAVFRRDLEAKYSGKPYVETTLAALKEEFVQEIAPIYHLKYSKVAGE